MISISIQGDQYAGDRKGVVHKVWDEQTEYSKRKV